MISKRAYFTIFTLFLMVFCLFMFIGISTNLDLENLENISIVETVQFEYDDFITPEVLNIENNKTPTNSNGKKQVAIISQEEGDDLSKLLIEWCVYNKYIYEVYGYLPYYFEIEDFDLIIFGDIKLEEDDKPILFTYADNGLTLIFTQFPIYQTLESDSQLADFFGIERIISQRIRADGIKIFPDFMIGGERIYQKGDYFGEEDDTSIYIPYYELRAGYEIFAVGLFDNYRELGINDKDLPPLLWRTKTRNSFVFVVNADIFKDISLLGVLTGFMSYEDECHIYPVVNAQTISLVDYPYFSDENKSRIEQIYSRGSDALARDILWPNIVQILKNYGNSFNFFASSQLDYKDEIEANGSHLSFYLKEINKLSGEMGLSLGQVSEAELSDIIDRNHRFYNKFIPKYNFTALFLSDFNEDEIKENLDHDFLNNISLIMSEYNPGDRVIDIVKGKVLSVKFNQDGYQHETLEDLQMKSLYNALGMSNMMVDIKRAIFPESCSDEWNNLSLEWSKGDTYLKDYKMFDSVSIYEMEKRVRRFLALDYSYEYNNDSIDIEIRNFDEEAYFIISIYDKSIISINKGEAKKISKDTYLVKVQDQSVHIELKEETKLESPKNNYIIPSDPEESRRQKEE